jgi:Protein of unknown function (DUF2937)
MFHRTLTLAIGFMGALAASQLPEFTQQYQQRLGGAVDELRRVVQRFDRDSVGAGEDRKGALARLQASPDELSRRMGLAMSAHIARLDTLETQQVEMTSAGSFRRIQAFLTDPDPSIASATWDNFQPAVPATGEGAASGGAGFLAGGAVMALLGRLFRRRSGVPMPRRA